jgi:hypothetical protein
VQTSSSEPRKRSPLIDRLFPILILIFATLAIVLAVTGGVDLRAIGLQLTRAAAAGDCRIRAGGDLYGAESRPGERMALLVR